MENSAKNNANRRSFLKTGVAVATVTILPRWILGGAAAAPPNEKTYIAIIGVGGQGRTNAEALFREQDAQIVAICDPNEEADYTPFYYGGKAGRGPVKQQIEAHYSKQNPSFKCKEYEDFRLMFDKEKGIDAVLIATPDHVHAVATATAMRLKKHVYCEKPLTHNVWEARQIAKIAKETKVATQMGNQGHSGEGIRMTCEWIWAGAIGQVREVHVWSDTGGWAKAPGRPKETPPVPKGLNWDLWLGPRDYRPYHPTYVPCNWRGWWPFGTGAIGDMACHNFDPAFWALKLESPISIEASAPWIDNDAVSPCSIIRYNFPARGDMPPVKVTWYDGGLRPEKPEELEEDQVLGGGGNGILFIGDKGKIMCAGWGGSPVLLPQSRMDEFKRPPKTIPRSKGHHRDWLDACKNGTQPSSNFEYSAKLTEVVLLGNVALKAKKKIYWDSENMRVKNAPEAEKFIKETYRQGWEVA